MPREYFRDDYPSAFQMLMVRFFVSATIFVLAFLFVLGVAQ